MRPPFEISPQSIAWLARIERLLGRYEGLHRPLPTPLRRKSVRVRTVHATVAIEGNTLTEDQVTALVEGKRVVGPAREIREVQNALIAYERLHEWRPERVKDFLKAHRVLMAGLLERAGRWRHGNVGVIHGSRVVHVAPPADRVASLVQDLLGFLSSDKQTHPVIQAAVVHYELEFIHPFADGNGRMGRLWHTLILSRFHPLFQYVPIESLVRERQAEYYRVLRECDRAGNSTVSVEFALAATHDALELIFADLQREPVTAPDRLETARKHFDDRWFTRKEYMSLFPKLSTATASRDLKRGVDLQQLQREGERSLAQYAFAKKRKPRLLTPKVD